MSKLEVVQASRRIEAVRGLSEFTKVRPGWIQFMRKALNMKVKDLAERSGLSSPTIVQNEKREATGSVSLDTLQKMARAMDCELVYAFVPKKELSQLIKDAARKKAAKLLRVADTHMELEDQKVKALENERIELLAEELILKGDVW